MRLLIALALLGCAKAPSPVVPSGTNPNVCFGEHRDIVLSRGMPLTRARVDASEGWFILDMGTTSSTIDWAGFEVPPTPINGQPDHYGAFEFFGPWGTVHLDRYDHHALGTSPRVAGLIGTDFMSQHVYTFDYAHQRVHRAGGREFCADDVLRAEGLAPLSTEGYYASDPARVIDAPNVPTVPIRIANVKAVAQLDTAFADSMVPHSVNINRALFDRLIASGVKLEKGASVPLSTCVAGVWETTVIYRGPARFEMVGVDGKAVRASTNATFLLKETPPAAMKCGGIGTWKIPAAQVGVSFYVDAGRLVFDPFTSRVWMPPT